MIDERKIQEILKKNSIYIVPVEYKDKTVILHLFDFL